jgi:hypothetical protein
MNKFQSKNKRNEKLITVVGIQKYAAFLNASSISLPFLFRRINGSIPRKYSKRNVALPKCDNVEAVMNRTVTIDQLEPRFIHNTRKQYSAVSVKIDDNEKGENHLGK